MWQSLGGINTFASASVWFVQYVEELVITAQQKQTFTHSFKH